MLTIVLPETEFFDNETFEFVTFQQVEVDLEHSLVSLSKWESKHEKPFLGKESKTEDEIMDYIICMICSGGIPEKFFERLDQDKLNKISKHIDAKMTATWFSDEKSTPSREIITSELIYYWMFSMNIPKECEVWHLNRLLTLIRVCNVKNQPPKKLSKAEIAARNRELNAKRREQFNTNG